MYPLAESAALAVPGGELWSKALHVVGWLYRAASMRGLQPPPPPPREANTRGKEKDHNLPAMTAAHSECQPCFFGTASSQAGGLSIKPIL